MIERTASEYKQVISACKALFAKKTHDDVTAWSVLRLSSSTDQIFIKAQQIRSILRVSPITDIILMKLLRAGQIEDLEGKTLAREGAKANYEDMINYSVFALIKA
jgi:hypothetical protein